MSFDIRQKTEAGIYSPEAWLAGLAAGLAAWASGLAGWASGLAGWPRGADERMYERTDGKSPHSTGLRPLSGPLPKKGGAIKEHL